MKSTIYILFFIMVPATALAQNQSPVTSKIEVDQDENRIVLKPVVQNTSNLYLEYNYLLLVKKNDPQNNLSINRQNGKFTLNPGDVKTLSYLQINSSKNQKITALLYIRDEEENRLITKDSVELGQINASEPVDESELMIHGMVVDESKTKLGKDFYDDFYSVYNQYPDKFSFIITITELPFRGMTSKIQVRVNQNIVHEFLSNPDEEYLTQQVQVSLGKLTSYATYNTLNHNY